MWQINFSSCIKANNKIWFVSVEGYLMNFDFMTCKTEIVVPQNLDKEDFKAIVDTMILHVQKIYFFSQDGKILYEYDLKSNYCSRYQLPEVEMINWGCFAGIYLWGEKIYIFTKVAGKIYYFDTKKKVFVDVSNENTSSVTSSIIFDNKVYMASYNRILCYNLDSACFESECSINDEEIYWMNRYHENIYLLTKTNGLYVWNIAIDTKKLIYQEKNEKQIYSRVFATENKIFLLPCLGQNIRAINILIGEKRIEENPSDLKYKEIGWSKYSGYCEDEKCIWCANRVSNYFLLIDKENEQIKWINMYPPESRSIEPYFALRKNNMIFNEGEFGLIEFLANLNVNVKPLALTNN